MGIREDFVEKAGADNFTRVYRDDSAPPILMAKEMMAALDTKDEEPVLRERGNEVWPGDARARLMRRWSRAECR